MSELSAKSEGGQRKQRRAWVLHPFLFAVYPVVFLLAENIEELRPKSAIPALGVFTLAAGVALLLGRLLLKDWLRSGITASAGLFLFASYGRIADLAKGREVLGLELGRDRTMFSIFAIVGLAILVVVARSRERLPEITRILNAVGLVLVGISVFTVVQYTLQREPAIAQVSGEVAYNSPLALKQPKDPPNIYFLIFDRYGGEETWPEFIGYDDSGFFDALSERGLFVAGKSRSNYPATALSLGASLNMTYLDFITEQTGEASNDWNIVRDIFRDNRVMRSLKEVGYKIVLIASYWDPTATNPLADVTLAYGSQSEFNRELIDTTALRPVGDKLQAAPIDRRRLIYETSLFQIAKVKDSVNIEGPKFVFAHILLPHDPFVFDAAGGFVPKGGGGKSYEELFGDQLTFTNSQILEILDKLFEGSGRIDNVIVLQADEGPHPRRFTQTQREFTWDSATDKEVQLKFPILSAFFLPGRRGAGLTQTTSPVNSFRVVLNEYFGAGLPILDDRSFVFDDWEHIYRFTEVTDLVTPVE